MRFLCEKHVQQGCEVRPIGLKSPLDRRFFGTQAPIACVDRPWRPVGAAMAQHSSAKVCKAETFLRECVCATCLTVAAAHGRFCHCLTPVVTPCNRPPLGLAGVIARGIVMVHCSFCRFL